MRAGSVKGVGAEGNPKTCLHSVRQAALLVAGRKRHGHGHAAGHIAAAGPGWKRRGAVREGLQAGEQHFESNAACLTPLVLPCAGPVPCAPCWLHLPCSCRVVRVSWVGFESESMLC